MKVSSFFGSLVVEADVDEPNAKVGVVVVVPLTVEEVDGALPNENVLFDCSAVF